MGERGMAKCFTLPRELAHSVAQNYKYLYAKNSNNSFHLLGPKVALVSFSWLT